VEAGIGYNGAETQDREGYGHTPKPKWPAGETWSMDGDEVVSG